MRRVAVPRRRAWIMAALPRLVGCVGAELVPLAPQDLAWTCRVHPSGAVVSAAWQEVAWVVTSVDRADSERCRAVSDETELYVAAECGMCWGVRPLKKPVKRPVVHGPDLGSGCENAHHYGLTLDQLTERIKQRIAYYGRPQHDDHQEWTVTWAWVTGQQWPDCPFSCSDWQGYRVTEQWAPDRAPAMSDWRPRGSGPRQPLRR